MSISMTWPSTKSEPVVAILQPNFESVFCTEGKFYVVFSIVVRDIDISVVY